MSNILERQLEGETGIKVVKKVKYLGLQITKNTIDLFEYNYKKSWSNIKNDLIKWNQLHISLLGRISTIQMMVLPKNLYLFQTLPIKVMDKVFNEWGKDLSQFIWRGRKPRIKLRIIQDAKARGGLNLPNMKIYHEACCLLWTKEWIELKEDRLL